MKKIWKRSLSLFMTGVLALGISGCGDVEKKENSYNILGMEEIPIGMWVTPPAQYRTQEYYDLMKECGINFINGFSYNESSTEAIQESLTLAEQSGLKFLVADSKVTSCIRMYQDNPDQTIIEEAMQQIEAYYKYPAYAGQLLLDEPSRNMFDTVHAMVDAYGENYPTKQWHINMFPMYAEGGIGVPYEQYVDDWLEMVQPNYYSYDSYPLLTYDENNPLARPEIEDYYYNLDMLRAKTREKEIPLWCFIQTLGISGTEGVADKRTPSREDIRWQVFTSLAFGVKGLQYFCYFTPEGGSESFTPALITTTGEKTERYDCVKELNNEIGMYTDKLIRCHADGVILNTTSKTGRYQLYEESLSSFDKLRGVEGDEVLIGCFTDYETEDKSVLITGTTPRDDAEITLTMKGGVKKVDAYVNGELTELKVEQGKLKLSIEKGDAVYLMF